jgi:16S rRNA (adenine1518-N6/adenine1519-N6)-dimethyltransferase
MSEDSAHRPRKRFGQHFLHERGVIDRILLALDPKPTDRIVEIGPGEGALTLPLLARAGRLTAIEIDRDLAPLLPARAAGIGELNVIEADALTVDYRALAAGGRLRLVGNLPYNISTPILFHLLEAVDAITDMHFMLQKEVVERMAAAPGSKTYGRLSVMLQARTEVEPLFGVAPGAFRPPPKVDSAVVRLIPKPAAAIADFDPDRLDRIVRAAFAQRRKTLHNALRGVVDDAELHAVGIDPRTRAEDVPVAGYLALARPLGATGN